MSAWNDFINRVAINPIRRLTGQVPYVKTNPANTFHQSYLGDPNGTVGVSGDSSGRQPGIGDSGGYGDPGTNSSYPGGYGPSGGGDGGTGPDLGALRNQAFGLIQNLNNLYNSIYGDVNNYAADQRGRVDQGYQQNLQDAQNAYTKGVDTAGLAYAGRGLGDSSYLGNQKQDLTNTYQADVNNQNQAHNAALAGISQNVQSALGQYQANQAKLGGINPNDYGTAADLQSLISQLTGQQDQLNQARPGFLTQSGLVDKLGAIAPAKQQTSDQISKALQQLTTSSAPQFAKDQLAQGIIQRANLQDQGAQAFWQDYYQKLLTGQVPSLPA